MRGVINQVTNQGNAVGARDNQDVVCLLANLSIRLGSEGWEVVKSVILSPPKPFS